MSLLRPRRGCTWVEMRSVRGHGTIDPVTTVLFYLVIAAVIGLVVFFLAVFVFGRGEQMAPLDPRTSPAELPETDITSQDVRRIRFALAVRGYRMSDVDWTLERLGEQLDALRVENDTLRADRSDDLGGFDVPVLVDGPIGSVDERVAVGALSGWQSGRTPTVIHTGPPPAAGERDDS